MHVAGTKNLMTRLGRPKWRWKVERTWNEIRWRTNGGKGAGKTPSESFSPGVIDKRWIYDASETVAAPPAPCPRLSRAKPLGRTRKPRNYFLAMRSAAPCVTVLPGRKAIGCRLSRGKKAEAFALIFQIC